MTENAGIKLENVHHVSIFNNILEENFFGIYLANVGETTITGNTLTGGFDRESNSGNGIHLWQCENIRITNNKVTKHRDAIYLEFVLTSIVEENFCMKNIRYGLHFMFSNDDSYINNTFKNNGAGVAVMYSHQVKMISNNFIKNQGPSSFGILLKDISDCEISKNTFSENTIAVRLEGTNRIKVQKNNFIENGWAVFVTANCSDNNFDSNNFKFNSFDVSTNGSLVMNQFDNNYWDKYEGYDLDRNGKGDIPFHPVSIFATVVSKIPESIMLYRSFTQYLMDRAEKVIPSVTPENLVDHSPLMNPVIL
jgi:nitrous oxidase accessory protein